MRMNRETRKRIMVSVVAVFIAVIMLLGIIAPFIAQAATPASDNLSKNVSITATAGMDGVYKINKPMQVNVVLENNAEGFDGELQIKTKRDTYNSENIINSYPIELPSGGTKKITMDIDVSTLIKNLEIDLVDEKNNVIANKKISLKGVPETGMLFGFLTDEPDQLNYFKTMHFVDSYYGEDVEMADSMINLSQSDLEISESLLENLTSIVINNYDTSKLTNEQVSWIRTWIEQGGNLIIGTGVNFDKVFKNLGDIISVSKLDLVEVDSIKDPQEFYDPIVFEGSKLLVTRFEALENATPILYSEDMPVSYLSQMGLGKIILHCFDLGLEPIQSNYPVKTIINNVYNENLSTQSLDYYYNSYSYNLNSLINDDQGKPSVIFWLLFAYVIFLGPVIYLMLKKLDKREKAWFIIPAGSFLLVLIIFLISRNSLYSNAIISNINKISLVNGSKTASVDMSYNVLTHEKGDINIEFSGDAPKDIIPASDNYYGYASYGYSSYGYSSYGYSSSMYFDDTDTEDKENSDYVKITHGDSPKLLFYDKMSWSDNYFDAKKIISINDGLYADLYLDGSTIKGIITNNTNMHFDDLIVRYDYFYEVFENVDPGEMLEVDFEMDFESDDYFELQNNYYMFGDFMMGSARIDGTGMVEYSQIEDAKQRNLKSIKSSIINDAFDPYQNIYTIPLNADELFEAEIVAFNDEVIFDSDVRVNNKQATTFELNFFAMKANINIDRSDKVEIPYGIIKPVQIYSSDGIQIQDMDATGVYVDYDGMEILFKYTAPSGMAIDYIVFGEEDYYSSHNTEIFNISSQNWEAVLQDASSEWTEHDDPSIFEDVEPKMPWNITYGENYIDSEGSITIRYINTPSGYLNYPKIQMTCVKR